MTSKGRVQGTEARKAVRARKEGIEALSELQKTECYKRSMTLEARLESISDDELLRRLSELLQLSRRGRVRAS